MLGCCRCLASLLTEIFWVARSAHLVTSNERFFLWPVTKGFMQVQEVVYGDQAILIQEGYLGDGLGARVWVAAHILCRSVHTPCSVVMHDA